MTASASASARVSGSMWPPPSSARCAAPGISAASSAPNQGGISWSSAAVAISVGQARRGASGRASKARIASSRASIPSASCGGALRVSRLERPGVRAAVIGREQQARVEPGVAVGIERPRGGHAQALHGRQMRVAVAPWIGQRQPRDPVRAGGGECKPDAAAGGVAEQVRPFDPERVEQRRKLPGAARHGHALGRGHWGAPPGAALVVADDPEARRQPVHERIDADRPAALRQQHRQRRAAAALLVVDVAAFNPCEGHGVGSLPSGTTGGRFGLATEAPTRLAPCQPAWPPHGDSIGQPEPFECLVAPVMEVGTAFVLEKFDGFVAQLEFHEFPVAARRPDAPRTKSRIPAG